MGDSNVQIELKSSTGNNAFKLLVYSAIGVFMFFIPITIGKNTTIPIDHIVNIIRKIPYYNQIYGALIVTIGGIYPFINKTWNKNTVSKIFSILKLIGIVVVYMAIFEIGPKELFEVDMIPFVFGKVVVPVSTIVPIGSVFLAFLVSYGLMEFVGVLMRPVMKPVWKTPGRSAIDAVASFVGSYSLALLITNRVYKEGKYTTKEACIIATGFSTVSATFMIIVANTLDIMHLWNTYFWLTFLITFIVTAITARLAPLSKKSEEYYEGTKGDKESEEKGNALKRAWREGIIAADRAPSLMENIVINFKDGIMLAISIAPTLMSIGFLGLVVAKYTPLFDIIGYVFYPFTFLLRIPEPLLAAKACAVSIAEMLLPAIVVANTPLVTRFIIAVVCVSEILFFSASIPCMLSTDIPLNIKDLVIIWFERVVLSLIITAPIAYLIL
ncbi:YjiH family protein [Clostridium sp. MSJ-11]|uniref:YjiH family protein n=1 Tax=Clostridium mobile TaxID=2841512 RepID=A0ABS6EK13_9CLOT|nr:YjiH family protein [Clostridium mobile]MBU5485554.1 YjiH family protein [Clostridium mobile]